MYNIGTQIAQGEKWPVGVGYVTIPTDIDREQFIAHCYQTNSLCIVTEDGGFHKNIPTDTWSFNFIDFPDKPGKNGSLVIYVQEPVHKELIIVATINSDQEIIDLREGQFKLRKKWNNNFVEISGSGKDGNLSLIVDAEDNANLLLHVNNRNNNAKLQMEVSGNIILEALNQIEVISKQNVILAVQNANDQTQQSTVKLSSDSIKNYTDNFVINEGTEPIGLGNQIKLIFDNLFDELGRSTTTTSIGQMPLLNAQQLAAMKQNTANILSQISFTD